jgi:hypothetical protein
MPHICREEGSPVHVYAALQYPLRHYCDLVSATDKVRLQLLGDRNLPILSPPRLALRGGDRASAFFEQRDDGIDLDQCADGVVMHTKSNRR